jgi:methyl-accepting chemotaxis protein WspA
MRKLKLLLDLILRRFTVLHKLILIGLMLGIPLTILLVISLNNLRMGIDFAQKEHSGIRYLKPLNALKVCILKHQSYFYAGFAAKTDFQSNVANLNSQIKDEFDRLITVAIEEGKDIELDEATLSEEKEYALAPKALLARWEKLVASQKNGQRQTIQQEYVKLINDIQKLTKLVSIKSNLILDPEGDSYYLMDVAVLKMPQVQVLLAEAFALAVEDEQDTVYNFDRVVEINYINRTLRESVLEEIPSSINSAIEQDPKFRGQSETLSKTLIPMVERYKTGIGSLIEVYENIIRNNKSYGVEDLTIKTEEQFSESLIFWNTSMIELENLLDTRLDYYYKNIIFTLMIAVLAFIIAMILIYFTAKGILTPVLGVAQIAGSLSAGDIKSAKEQIKVIQEKNHITSGRKTRDRDEIWNLFRAVRATIFDMETLLGEVSKAGVAVTSSVTQIASSVQSLNAAINEQAASTAEVNATGKEIYNSSIHLSETVVIVSDKSSKTLVLADKGAVGLSEITQSMASLEKGSKDISEKLTLLYQKTSNITNVITTITKIATQTNLLSLNASIEAEKAGEYGAGFSVVAIEIKRLAEETALAALEIEEMIHEMQQSVKEGVIGVETYAGTTRSGVGRISGIAESLNEIIQHTKDVLPSFEVVSSQMQMQTEGAAQISGAMNELNMAALHTRESVSEFTDITSKLDGAVKSLREVVSKFKFGS